jgi:tetratricopeptide (TPR) repeat protein/O-antigen ligase
MRHLSRLARRTAHLLTLEAFGLAVLAFPMQVTPERLASLDQGFRQSAWIPHLQQRGVNVQTLWDYDVAPLINSGFEPLILKEGLVKGALLLALVAWILGHLTRRAASGPRRLTTVRLVWFVLTIAVLTSSLLRGTQAADGGRVMVWLQTRSYFNALAGLLFLALLTDSLRCRRMADRWIGWVYVVAAPVMVIALLQHLGDTLLPPTAPSWLGIIPVLDGGQFPRNVIGSLIGHNNGASLLCVPGLCLAPAVWRRARSDWLRALLLLWVLLALWVIVRGQSRSLILAIACGLALWAVLSRVWLPRPARPLMTRRAAVWILAVGAAFALVQSVPNPLRGTEGMGAHFQRLIDRSDLVTDTRVRVAVCGLPAFRERFLAGWGVGSFSYIYPYYQGDYFTGETHWDTPLHLTDKITQRAHNDWLQLGIETGVLGLTVVLLGLWLWWGRGWRFARRGCGEPDEPMLRGTLAAGLIFIFQALFDFPLHVAPTALLALLLVALAGNAPEVWGRRRFAERLEIRGGNRIVRWVAVTVIVGWCLWSPRWWAVPAHSLNPASMAPSFPLAMRHVAAEVMANARHVRALADIDWYSTHPEIGAEEGLQWLDGARRRLRGAIQIDPANGFVRHLMAEALTYLGQHSPQHYLSALKEFDVANDEVRNYRTFYYTAECHYGLSRHHLSEARRALAAGDREGAAAAGVEERRHLARALEFYDRALQYNPSDAHSADTLAKLYLREGLRRHAVGVIRTMRRWAPEAYVTRWVGEAVTLINLGQYEKALERVQVMHGVEPESLEARSLAAEIYVRTRDLARARATLAEAERLFPGQGDLFAPLHAKLLILEGDLEGALVLLREIEEWDPGFEMPCFQHLVLRKLGRTVEAQEAYRRAADRLADQGLGEWVALDFLGNVAWELFDDRELAEHFYRGLADDPTGPIILLYTRLATLAAERGERDQAIDYLWRVRQVIRDYEPAEALWRELTEEEPLDRLP